MPLKTFARYELLFKQMLKLTPEHRSEEHAGLTTVLEKLEAIKSNANAVAAKMQQLETSYGGTPHTRTMVPPAPSRPGRLRSLHQLSLPASSQQLRLPWARNRSSRVLRRRVAWPRVEHAEPEVGAPGRNKFWISAEPSAVGRRPVGERAAAGAARCRPRRGRGGATAARGRPPRDRGRCAPAGGGGGGRGGGAGRRVAAAGRARGGAGGGTAARQQRLRGGTPGPRAALRRCFGARCFGARARITIDRLWHLSL